MKDDWKAFAYGILKSKTGNAIAPVRWAKGALLSINALAGEPLLSKPELEARRERFAAERKKAADIGAGRTGAIGAAAVGLGEKKAADKPGPGAGAGAGAGAAGAEKPKAKEAAPVVVYMDWNSRHDLKRMVEVLVSAAIPYQQLDVTEDEATRSFVKAAMLKIGQEDLPVLFIAGEAVGGFQQVTQLDVSGELKRKVFGA